MAYPTTLNYLTTSPGYAGASAITAVDTVARQPLGTRIRAQDSVNGEAEFIYIKGVALVAAGDLVAYDPSTGTAVRTVAATRGPVAVAMAAVVANTWGWFAVYGVVPVNTTAAGTGAANAGLAVTATPGQATVRGAAGQAIDNIIAKSAQDAPGAGFTNVLLNYPAMNGLT